ncbi:hypothetical protein CPB84DRAFT_1752446 [Gymnopilus junonius]|uniref:Uncharacterized protein n=1 Tax=Gymnopilus junonius TaxID=109634 RepID=A0A9P5TGY4_GYMJU|nr:hypothetical protein CPB84DRAFT_1752446 [Gymnopilus junonius]
MPICHCHWAKCNGRVVGQRLFDSHLREDKRIQANAALEAASQACEDQDTSIVSYISALTLSDATTGISAIPGGRLWSRTGSSQSSTDVSPQQLNLPVTEALYEIRDIEKGLDALIAHVDPQLRLLEPPPTHNNTIPFPLRISLCDASRLHNRLSSISIWKAPVQEAKKAVNERLVSFIGQLRKANSSWIWQSSVLHVDGESIQDFDTGMPAFFNHVS